MEKENKGYWIYSIFTVLFFIVLLGFLGYLLYDLIIKLSEKDLSNNTVIQALITLVITVFIGGYFSKWLERRNAKKLEVFKIQREISLKIVDYASALYYHPDNIEVKELLIAESSKVKLFFDDETLNALNEFIKSENKGLLYDNLIDKLKKAIKF